MKAAERRQKIIDILSQTQVPISASSLASRLGVSRQIIVGDVALLRAANHDVISTPKGYVMSQALYSHQFIGKIACQHGPERTKEELDSIKKWLKENYNSSIKSVSFLLHHEHGFKQAPLQEIDEETYNKMVSRIKKIDSLSNAAFDGEIDSQECQSGACPIK